MRGIWSIQEGKCGEICRYSGGKLWGYTDIQGVSVGSSLQWVQYILSLTNQYLD